VTGDVYLRWENGPVPKVADVLLKKMNGQEIKITTKKN
jgi:hypothetical protein